MNRKSFLGSILGISSLSLLEFSKTDPIEEVKINSENKKSISKLIFSNISMTEEGFEIHKDNIKENVVISMMDNNKENTGEYRYKQNNKWHKQIRK